MTWICIVAFVIFSHFSIVPGLKENEELKFIDLTSIWRIWQMGHFFHLEDCLFYSFGYDRELPYTKIDLNLEENIDISINTKGLETSTSCSVVLIAGKFVGHINEVMKKMDDVTEQIQSVPIAAFVFEDFSNDVVDVDISLRLL